MVGMCSKREESIFNNKDKNKKNLKYSNKETRSPEQICLVIHLFILPSYKTF